MKFNYVLQVNNTLEVVTPELLKSLNAANQTLAIIADAVGIKECVASFKVKNADGKETGEIRKFIPAPVCQQILDKLSA